MSKSKRSLLCQLRLGILPVEIEVGRFSVKNKDRWTSYKNTI